MKLDRAEVGAPSQRLDVVDEDVLDEPLVMTSRDLGSLDPVGRMAGRILFVEPPPRTPLGNRIKVTGRSLRWGSIAGATAA